MENIICIVILSLWNIAMAIAYCFILLKIRKNYIALIHEKNLYRACFKGAKIKDKMLEKENKELKARIKELENEQ